MTKDNLPLIALLLGAVPMLTLIGFGIRACLKAKREHAAKWAQLTDPSRCWDCGGVYHYPCPETTWWRNPR